MDEENENLTINKYYELQKETELRIECSDGESVSLRVSACLFSQYHFIYLALFIINHESQLECGTAEVFGAELQVGVAIKVEAQKIAVFTWSGCKVHVEGKAGVIYTAGETPMTSYLNIHTILNNRRKEALSSGKRGPHCIILGPTDSGKSTLTKCLCNWAVRSGWEPAMVDLGEIFSC